MQLRTADRRRRALGAVLAVAGIGLTLAGCSSTETSSGTDSSTTVAPSAGGVSQSILGPADLTSAPQDGGEIVMGLEAEPTVLDPSRGTFDQSANFIASTVYDPLVTLDAEGKAVPYLAKTIEPSDDFLTWTITLPEGVLFHDGTTLDADAVALNFKYWTESFITAPSLSSVQSFEVTGPLEVTVHMSQPWATFPYALTTQTGYIAAPSYLTNPDPPAVAMQPIGTGPFRAGKYSAGESFVVSRFDDYWQPELPHLDGYTFRFLPDPKKRLEALESGDIDMMHGYRPVELDTVRAAADDGDVKVVENAELEEDVIAINTEVAPFDDLDARRALALSTDAAAWREIAEAGTDHEVRGPFAKGQLGYSEDDAYPAFDLAEATKLADAYEARTGSPIEATLLTTGTSEDQELAQLLVSQWAAAGIEITVESANLSTLIFRTVSGEYQLVSWRNFGSPDADGEYLWWHQSGILAPPKISTNVARFGNDEIDQALDKARGSDDSGERDLAYQSVVRQLNENVAYVWLGRPTWVIAAAPDVQGIAAATNGSGANLGNKTWMADLWLSR